MKPPVSDKPPKLGLGSALAGGALLAASLVFRPEPSPAQEAQKLCQKAFQEADAAVRKKYGYFMASEGQKAIEAVLKDHQACMQRTYARNKTTTKQERKP